MEQFSDRRVGSAPTLFQHEERVRPPQADGHASLPVILASASPRRQELIALLGIPYRIVPSQYVEPPPPSEPVSLPDLVIELAKQKAREVAARSEPGWVLGADTLVSLEDGTGTPLGKPLDQEDARRMLRLLSGRTHYVYTGLALLPSTATSLRVPPACVAVKTGVVFRALSEAMIDDYVATGEPMDKAGAYGAQGYAAPFIERYEGDFFNVVGLPLCETGRLLEKCGVEWWKNREISV